MQSAGEQPPPTILPRSKDSRMPRLLEGFVGRFQQGIVSLEGLLAADEDQTIVGDVTHFLYSREPERVQEIVPLESHWPELAYEKRHGDSM